METIMVSMETNKPVNGSVPKLENHLGYWLRRVSNVVSGEFARCLQRKQTSVAEWVLLCQLHERGQATPSELAEVLGMTRGAISKVVDKLQAKRWLQTQSIPGDNRVQLLSLTHQGLHNLPILGKVADANDTHFFSCLKPAERLALQKLLVKIAENHQIRQIPIA
jgi:DNA-binding MarR family transcriptional regulator